MSDNCCHLVQIEIKNTFLQVTGKAAQLRRSNSEPELSRPSSEDLELVEALQDSSLASLTSIWTSETGSLSRCSETPALKECQSEASLGSGMRWADIESDIDFLDNDTSSTGCPSEPSEPATEPRTEVGTSPRVLELDSVVPVVEAKPKTSLRTRLSSRATPFVSFTPVSAVEPEAQSFWEEKMPLPNTPPAAPCEVATPPTALSGQAEDEAREEVADGVAGTTVMFCRLPTSFLRDQFLELLDSKGFKGCYDYVYLPIKMRSMTNVGYAFVNLVDEVQANRFFETFHGYSDWGSSEGWSGQAAVTWGRMQGFWDNVERYRNSPIMANSVPESCKPAVFENGNMVAFPRPTEGAHGIRHKRMQMRNAIHA